MVLARMGWLPRVARIAGILALVFAAMRAPALPGGETAGPLPAGTPLFTDVTSTPPNGWVTVYQWTGDRAAIITRYKNTGAPQQIGERTIIVPVHQGRVREATPSTLAGVIRSIRPGDQILLRTGIYADKYDANGWNESNFVLNEGQSGTAAQPIHLTSYPGDRVEIRNLGGRPNFTFGRQSIESRCNHWTVSNLILVAESMNVFGGGVTANATAPETGATDVRIVGNTLRIWLLGHGDSGQVELQGDGWKVLGNDFQNDYGRQVDNMNHSVYIDDGADDAEIAYNRFVDRREGFVIMVHMDGRPMLYTGNWVHHNYVRARAAGDVRGISSSNVDDGSTLLVEDNYFENVGIPGEFGPLTVYRGTVTARRNTFVNPGYSIVLSDLFGGVGRLVVGSGANANTWSSSLPTYAFDGRSRADVSSETAR